MEYGVWSMEYGVWSMEYGVKSKQTETLNFPDSYRERTPNSKLETQNSKLTSHTDPDIPGR